MALENPPYDPAVEAQLYGPPDVDLSDIRPAGPGDPWSWIPEHWNDPDPEAFRRTMAGQQIGPSAVGAPLEQAAAPVPVPTSAPVGPLTAPPIEPDSPAVPPIPAPEQGIQLPFAAGPIPAPAAPLIPAALPSMAPPPAIDALSDAGGMPSVGDLGGTAYAPTRTPEQLPEAHFSDTAARFAADPLAIPDPAERQRFLNELAQRDPAGFADLQLRHETARQREVDAKRLELANRDYEQQVVNIKMRQEADRQTQQKVADLLTRSADLANQKTDPSGGVHGLQAVTGVLQSIVGGLYQSRHGGPNIGLQSLNDTINRGIEAQKADFAKQRDLLGLQQSAYANEIRQHGDDFLATEALRLAGLKRADAQLATEQQNYDPAGTTALRIAALRAGIAAQQQAGVQAFAQKNFENNLKLQDAARQQQIADEAQRHNRAQEGVEWSKAQAELGKNAQTKFTPQELQALHPGLPVPPIGMTQKEYGQWLESGKTGEELIGKTRANSPNERARELAVAGVVDNKGEPVLFRNDTVAAAVSQSKEDSEELIRLTDELAGMIKKNGWSSDFVKSEAWRKARANYGQIIIRKKEQDKLGVLTGPDVDLVTKEIGTEDPTEVRGEQALAGLKQFRHNIVEGLNAKMRNAAFLPDGRSVKRWDPPDLSDLPEAKDTADDTRRKAVLGKGDSSRDAAIQYELHKRVGDRGIDLANPRDTAALQAARAAAEAPLNAGVSAPQFDEIERLGKLALSGGPEAARARDELTTISTKALTPGVRALAKSWLAPLTPSATPRGPTSEPVLVVPDALRLQ